MLNRRFLRIKVLQILYAHWAKPGQNINATFKELELSTQKTLDLFYWLLSLYVELVKHTEALIELRRNKITANALERNPNMRFVDNEFLTMLTENETFKTEVSNRKINLGGEREFVKKMARNLLSSSDYEEYTNQKGISFETDKNFVKHLFEIIFYNSEDLYSLLEERNLYWVNDIDFIIKKICTFIDQIKENKPATIRFPKLYKKEDDRTFARDLLVKAISKKVSYEELIEEQIVNWDIERVTQTDRLILLLAVAEIEGFPAIPVKVSINEYIEISKLYSSPRNAKFVNGVIDKTVQYMRENEMFKKTGRGLIE